MGRPFSTPPAGCHSSWRPRAALWPAGALRPCSPRSPAAGKTDVPATVSLSLFLPCQAEFRAESQRHGWPVAKGRPPTRAKDRAEHWRDQVRCGTMRALCNYPHPCAQALLPARGDRGCQCHHPSRRRDALHVRHAPRSVPASLAASLAARASIGWQDGVGTEGRSLGARRGG